MTAIPTARGPAPAQPYRVQVWQAGAAVLITFACYLPTYWLQVPAGTFPGSVLVHIHALLFSGWPLMLFVQARSAARGELLDHRAWGLAGVALASAMLVVGIATAHARLVEGLARGYGDGARSFLIVQLSVVVTFAAVVAAAVALRRRVDWHRRLMIGATALLLEAPLARIPFAITRGHGPGIWPGAMAPPPVIFATAPAMAANLILVAGLIHDIRTRGRPHPAYPVALAVVAGTALLRVPISQTHAWLAFADAFARIAG